MKMNWGCHFLEISHPSAGALICEISTTFYVRSLLVTHYNLNKPRPSIISRRVTRMFEY